MGVGGTSGTPLEHLITQRSQVQILSSLPGKTSSQRSSEGAFHVAVTVPFVAVYLWSVFALAIGATMALLYLIQKGEAAKAASLIYLVPPVSAVMAWLGFDEPIGWTLIAGFAIAALGVAMVQAKS